MMPILEVYADIKIFLSVAVNMEIGVGRHFYGSEHCNYANPAAFLSQVRKRFRNNNKKLLKLFANCPPRATASNHHKKVMPFSIVDVRKSFIPIKYDRKVDQKCKVLL